MIYVASVITFNVFFELLWKSTLLVCYKLNRFRPPQVNQFDIPALLFIFYARFVSLDKMVYIDNRNLSQLALTFFHCVMDYYFSLLNYPLGRIIIALWCYVCFYYILSGWNNITILTPNYWRFFWTIWNMRSVHKF